MTSADEDPVAAAMKAILTYLRAHPHAKDTAAGIVQWWVPASAASMQPWHVQEALGRLVAAGLIRAQSLPGGAIVYGDREFDV